MNFSPSKNKRQICTPMMKRLKCQRTDFIYDKKSFDKEPYSVLQRIAKTLLKRPLIRGDLKVIQYQSQEADNTFITSDSTSPYNSTRKWAVKRHYREDNN